jgi:hypothetical protein
MVKNETVVINKHDKIIENVGEKNHDKRINQSFFHPMSSIVFEPTKPAPIKAPTTVCVPEIGIPVNEAVIMKIKDTRHTENIILYSFSNDRVVYVGSQLISVITS